MNINGIHIDYHPKFKSLRHVEWYANINAHFIFFPFMDDDLYADLCHEDIYEIQFKENVKWFTI